MHGACAASWAVAFHISNSAMPLLRGLQTGVLIGFAQLRTDFYRKNGEQG